MNLWNNPPVTNSRKLVTKSGMEREKDGVLRVMLESDFDVGEIIINGFLRSPFGDWEVIIIRNTLFVNQRIKS